MSAVLQPGRPSFSSMQTGDLDAVLDIERRCYEFPWTEGIFRDCIRVGYSCWVMHSEDTLIGYGLMSCGAGEAHILNLCIEPGLQRCGHGRAMLRHLLERAARYGADTIMLEVRPSNRAALEMYERAGFNRVGCRQDYYPARGGREDALVLALAL